MIKTITPRPSLIGVVPFDKASTIERDIVYGLLADHKVYEITTELAYVCTGCGTIGEMAPPVYDYGKCRDTFVNNYDLSCCGTVFTFAGWGK